MADKSYDVKMLAYAKPDDAAPKTPEWYLQYARYVANQYNPVLPNDSWWNKGETNTADGTLDPSRWADRCMQVQMYLYGIQNNQPINYMASDELNNPLPVGIQNDETIYELYKHLMGAMVEKMMKLSDSVYAKNMSEEALEEKEMVFNAAKAKIELKEAFQKMAQNGAAFNPEAESDIEKYGEESVTDAVSSYFTAWSKDWLWKTDWETWTKQAFEYLLPAYFCRAELYVEDGYVKVRIPRPAYCIWDNSADHEYGKLERYQGDIQTFSIPELFATYKFSEPEKEEIKQVAFNAGVMGNLNASYYNNLFPTAGLVWWDTTTSVPLISVAKTRFQTLDDEGNVSWYQADLIGNKYIKKEGKVTNQRVDSYGNPLPPFIDFIPDMQYGFNRSDFHRMITLANQIKGIETKILFLIVRTKGRVPAFFVDNNNEGMDAQEFLRQVSQGVIVLKKAQMDQMSEAGKQQQFYHLVDLSADALSIQTFRNEIEVKKNQMRAIASVPLISLGFQAGQTGKGVQDRTIEQATYGQLPLTHGFTQWVNNVVSAACEMRKNLIYLQKDNKREVLQISRRQHKIFEIVKEFTNAQLGVYLTDTDEFTQAQKDLMMSIFEREAQIPNNYITSVDVAEAMQCNTVTELVNLLNYKKKTYDRKVAQAAAETQKQENINNDLNRVTQENLVDKQVQGNLANTALKTEGELEKEEMKMAQPPSSAKPA